jgi:hypothetical protein
MVAGRSLSVTANKAVVNEAAATLNYERERGEEKKREEKRKRCLCDGVVSTHVTSQQADN